jgi:hypothetical protein
MRVGLLAQYELADVIANSALRMSTWKSQILIDSYLSGRQIHKIRKARESRSR